MSNLVEEKTFHGLADHGPEDGVAPEIAEKLDEIARVVESMEPASEV